MRSNIEPYEGNEKYIFISYSHKDSEKVFRILEILKGNGFRFWYDEGIEPGSEWPEQVAEHLYRSAVCIAFISPNSMDSPNCRREINYAISRNKNFLTVILEPTELSPGMEMQLSTYQSVLAYKYGPNETARILCGLELLMPCKDNNPGFSGESAAGEAKDKDTGAGSSGLNENSFSGPGAGEGGTNRFPGGDLPDPQPPQEQKGGPFALDDPVPPADDKKKKKKGRKADSDNSGKEGGTGGGKGKKKGLIVGIIAAVLGAAALAFVFAGGLGRVKIGDKTYKDDTTVHMISGQTLTSSNIAAIARFKKCISLNISDCVLPTDTLSKLSKMKNLQRLIITGSEIKENISVLNKCSRMYELELRNCALTDALVEGYTGTEKLRTLNLGGNSLTRVPTLGSPEKLTTLVLDGNQFTDDSFLAPLTSLETLNVRRNSLTKFSNLASEKLKVLLAGDNQISDVQGLRNMVYLTQLDLGGNQLGDLSPLENMTRLEKLDLSGNTQITDLNIISINRGSLTHLDISGIPLEDASAAGACKKLKALCMDACGLSSLDELTGLAGLKWLSVQGNELTDLQALKKDGELEFLNAADNRIASIEGIKLSANTILGANVLLQNNKIASWEGMPKVECYVLAASGNPAADYSPLKEIEIGRVIITVTADTDLASLKSDMYRSYYVTDVPLNRKVDLEEAVSSVYYEQADDVIEHFLGSDRIFSFDI